ncbi:hypothetical protein GLIP_0839 [Aliiglaciecola lipolytica E3]|uniref:Uncharacterized protein n=1 Tax=Aliiglaciecola lipolytica E3 TaxID=1127673 RepID=K6WYE7_9ALTE|nr:hypothetical protein GLIP_0839 [Aliiglaciecola lipolytica E3]
MLIDIDTHIKKFNRFERTDSNQAECVIANHNKHIHHFSGTCSERLT